jgi:hypothetical protein
LAIADASVIAETASLKPDNLLREYQQRRNAASERSLSMSRVASNVLSLPFPLGLMLPWAAWLLNKWPILFGNALRFSAKAFRE